MPGNADNFQFLIQLLDDDNEQSASMAMAALLEQEDAGTLESRLKQLPAPRNPRLKQRMAQLEKALFARRTRTHDIDAMRIDTPPLFDALLRLHLIWFDHDLKRNVLVQWNDLLRDAALNVPVNLQELALFLMGCHFAAPPPDDVDGSFYCIGSVIDDGLGADIMLAALTALLGKHLAIPLHIIRCGSLFGVADSYGNLVLPAAGWQLIPVATAAQKPVIWNNREIVHYTALMLLFSAIASDGFRYVHIFSDIVAALDGTDKNAFLPFPYAPNPLPKGC